MVTHLSLAREGPLGREMATHSSTLAWKIPQTEEPGRPRSVGSQRVGCDWATPSLHLSYVDGCLLYADWGVVHISWQVLKSYFTGTQPLANCLISSESPSCSKRYFPVIVYWLLPFWWKVSENWARNQSCWYWSEKHRLHKPNHSDRGQGCVSSKSDSTSAKILCLFHLPGGEFLIKLW